MASDFVRNIKGVKNIDILSPNITTENDLISTREGEVYIVTNKGYRKITNIETKDFEALKNQADTNTINISDLTDDIDTLNTTTETNTSNIESLKTSTDTNTSDISNLNTSTETIKNDVKSLKSKTANNTSNIETLTTTTDTNTSEIETLRTSTDTNTSDIKTLQTDVSNNTSEIETLKTLTDNNTLNDTGWIPFDLINGAVGDTAFKNESDNGFNCAYRIIEKDGFSEKRLRINAKNISNSQVIAQLPQGFAKNLQSHFVRVPRNLGLTGMVGIYPNGKVYVYVNSDKITEWESTNGDDVYFYGEMNWLD